MADNLTLWTQRINEGNIPVFKSTIQAISNLTRNDDASASQLASAVLRDPSLTARILKFANSPFYNPSRTATNTISRAVVIMGFDVVRELSLSVTIIDSLLANQSRQRVSELMALSFHAAVQAKTLAEKIGVTNLEEIFVATLLYEIGEMAFWCLASEAEVAALREAMEKPGTTPEQAQKEVLGFIFADLTESLAAEWKLSETLRHALLDKGESTRRTQLIRLSRDLATAIGRGWKSMETGEVVQRLTVFLNLPAPAVKKIIRQNAAVAAEVAAGYGAKTVTQYIPSSDEPPPSLMAESDAEPVISHHPEPNPLLQLKILRELSSMLGSKPDLNIVLETLLEGIHRGVGMDRALFALHIPLKGQVRAKFVVGDTIEYLLNNFAFSVEAGVGNPFGDLLFERKCGIWVRNTVHNEFSKPFMRQLRDLLDVTAFFITPIIVRGHPIGLFYADRQTSKRPLDATSFESFEHLGQQACLSIEHLSRI